MAGVQGPEWRISEDAGEAVLVALFVRQALGLRAPEDLPSLRDIDTTASPADDADLERQWRALWAMTVEPTAHPSSVPLELVPGYDTHLALPTTGADELRRAIMPLAEQATAFARRAHERHVHRAAASPGTAYRGYASAIAGYEREVGRRAHSFELNVQVLPLRQRGVWWIGALTIAVTDTLRADVAAFDAAIHPIIADLA